MVFLALAGTLGTLRLSTRPFPGTVAKGVFADSGRLAGADFSVDAGPVADELWVAGTV